jgi:hypothetical protein
MLSATPESMRGRLTGIEFMQVASAPTLGNVEAGVVASLTSLRFSIVSGGLACVAGTIVVAAQVGDVLLALRPGGTVRVPVPSRRRSPCPHRPESSRLRESS